MADNALNKLKTWLMTCPFIGMDTMYVDYTDRLPSNGGLFPSGLTEVARRRDILGKVFEVQNQLNFALYSVFEKAPGDNYGSTVNAEWVQDFQEWVQMQSISGLAPMFGDVPSEERITAQNGVLYDATDEGIGVYMVQITVSYIKRF